MLLDKKTFLEIWLNPELKLTIFRGTWTKKQVPGFQRNTSGPPKNTEGTLSPFPVIITWPTVDCCAGGLVDEPLKTRSKID